MGRAKLGPGSVRPRLGYKPLSKAMSGSAEDRAITLDPSVA